MCVAGILCGVLIGGRTGGALAFGLLLFGTLGALFLIYIEVGRSEDREREAEEAARREAQREREHVDSTQVERPRFRRRPD